MVLSPKAKTFSRIATRGCKQRIVLAKAGAAGLYASVALQQMARFTANDCSQVVCAYTSQNPEENVILFWLTNGLSKTNAPLDVTEVAVTH